MLKFVTLKSWKTIPLPLKICQYLITKPHRMFSGPWVRKDLKRKKMSKNLKILHVFSKKAKIRDGKMLNH